MATNTNTRPQPIQGSHCELCGSTDYEDLHTGDQGYTACCNEPVCYSNGCVKVDGYHERNAR